jgi:hypothetical protein
MHAKGTQMFIKEATPMTRLLEQAIEKVRKLAPSEQDAIASIILEELADEDRWERSFETSPEKLEYLLEQARKEIESGKVRDAGMDEL